MRPWRSPARALVLIALLAAAASAPVAAQERPKPGGILKAAIVGEPPTLDLHGTTATLTQQITWHIYETLYTYDQDLNPIPMLAEGHTVTDGGQRYTIRLRRGVKFHHGREMTAADVVASLTRWGRMASGLKSLWKNVEALEAKDSYTVVFHLKEPTGSLLYALGRYGNGGAIYPKEVVDGAGDGPIKEFIGTGPFRFVEHRPDRHIRLARFNDYAARPEAPDGFGGRRSAYVDEIRFIPVPDVALRLAGVQTGEYHWAQQIKQDQYERIKTMPGVVPGIVKPAGWMTAVFNHKQGLMTDKRIRQAFQAALDMEPVLAGAFGHKAFYRVDPSLLFREQPFWHSTAGAEYYNQRNRAKAQRLLREAGYAGQPVRFMTTKEYEYHYKTALVASQQLEQAGFTVDLQVYDWATLVQRRNKPELFDVFTTGIVGMPADPAFTASIDCNWPGWWCLEEKNRLVDQLVREADPKKRKPIWDRIQQLFYEDAGRIKFGDYYSLEAYRKELKGFRPTSTIVFWNVWLETR
jgi:peptide/nickel transport system substrate-binding protein